MPIYEYRCDACGEQMEKLQRMSDDRLVDCPACGKPALTRLVSAAAFRLKGAGWYETDFKKDNKRNLADGSSNNASAGASDSGASAAGGSSDSKAANGSSSGGASSESSGSGSSASGSSSSGSSSSGSSSSGSSGSGNSASGGDSKKTVTKPATKPTDH